LSASLTDEQLILRLRRLATILEGTALASNAELIEAFITRYKELLQDYEYAQERIGRLETVDETKGNLAH